MGIVENEYLVLEDVGCELRGYVSDLTRIWPSYGSFSSAQEELYNLILQTNKISVELCEPGDNIREIHNFSVEMLHKGLKEIGILKDSRSNSYHQMNPTSIGFSVHSLTKISVFCFSNIIRHQSDYVLHLSTSDLAYQDVKYY
ncbi:intermediate cleaving peptidase 55, mitochondrial [Malus domestica]|uniref:intermediate cleaving peptidase 55, mitochondrial n=1 Tax=Malus domestica TaxID=3750 RepID=UPI00397516FE